MRTTHTVLGSLPPRRPMQSRPREASTRRRRRPHSMPHLRTSASAWARNLSASLSSRRRSRAWSCPPLCLRTSSNISGSTFRSCRRTRLCRGGRVRARGLLRMGRRTLVHMDLHLRYARPRRALRLPHHLISLSIHPCKSSDNIIIKYPHCPARVRSPTPASQARMHRLGICIHGTWRTRRTRTASGSESARARERTRTARRGTSCLGRRARCTREWVDRQRRQCRA